LFNSILHSIKEQCSSEQKEIVFIPFACSNEHPLDNHFSKLVISVLPHSSFEFVL